MLLLPATCRPVLVGVLYLHGLELDARPPAPGRVAANLAKGGRQLSITNIHYGTARASTERNGTGPTGAEDPGLRARRSAGG